MKPTPDSIAQALNEQRAAFKAFLVARIGSEAEAEDILQDALMQAFRHGGEIADSGKATAWFYRVLRNAIVDHYRSRDAVRRRNDTLGQTLAALAEDFAAVPPAWKKQICGCLTHVIGTLHPRQATLLRRVDLDGESVQAAAKALGLSPNSASVTLHRARRELRARLEVFCGACADDACLDCHCAPVGNVL